MVNKVIISISKWVALIVALFLLVIIYRVFTSGPSLCDYEAISFWEVSDYEKMAKAGNADAAIALYDYYGDCNSTSDEREKWMRIAAENGNANFQLLYAHKHLKLGDIETGLNWTKMAAKQDYLYAILDMAEYYEKGEYVDKDLGIASTYYIQAATQGSFTAMLKLSKKLKTYVPCQNRKKWLEQIIQTTKPETIYHTKAQQHFQNLECK